MPEDNMKPDKPANTAPSKPVTLEAFEQIAARLGTPDWVLAGVASQEHWPVGREMTQADFEAACEKLLTAPLGGG